MQNCLDESDFTPPSAIWPGPRLLPYAIGFRPITGTLAAKCDAGIMLTTSLTAPIGAGTGPPTVLAEGFPM